MIDWKDIGLDEALTIYRSVGWRVRLTGAAVLLALGELVAVVVDPAGREALSRLEHAHGAVPPTLEILGDEGARVLLYRPRGHVSTTVGLHGTAPGLSVLSAGREIPLPPSRDGRRLSAWPKRREPRELTQLELARVPELPDWLFRAAVDSIAARALWTQASRSDSRDALPGTDVGNAERLARSHGADLRWVEAWGTWLAWDGRRWSRDDTGEVVRRAVDTVRQIGAEAAACEHEGQRKALLTHALKSESARSITSMVALARSQSGIAASPAAFDADPWALCVRNGTLDLRTGRLAPHQRDQLITKMCPVDFDPEAPAPVFDAFLRRSIPDVEVRAYLQRLAGCAVSGEIREHVLPIHWGGGSNGKSTLTEILLHVLGEYAQQVPAQVLLAKEHDAHPTERATLRGLRLAACSETAQGRALDEAQVKALTGGERISARVMRGDFFDFPPTHLLWVSTNNRPRVRETTNGIWRRVHLIPWTVEIAAKDQDTELPAKLRAEAAGVLRWAVEGCLAWQESGLSPPAAVLAATETYRAESDWLKDFLEACTRPGLKVLAGTLFRAYVAWCDQAGLRAVSQTAFGRAMSDRGVAKSNVHGYPWYQGIELDTEPEEQPTPPPPDASFSSDSDDHPCLS